jgi:Holliday junction resolvase-like predicted endonuclease
LLALKSISSQQKGLEAEKIVAAYFKARGCQLLRHRYQSPFGEIDLIFRSRNSDLLLVEVKTISQFSDLKTRVSRNQKRRLKNCLIWFSERDPHARLLLAVVNSLKEVLVLDDVFR